MFNSEKRLADQLNLLGRNNSGEVFGETQVECVFQGIIQDLSLAEESCLLSNRVPL